MVRPSYEGEKMIVVPFLAIATIFAILWSAFKYQTTYVAVIDTLPLQFRDGLNSRYAFPEYVLRPSTPLALQAEYVKSQIGFTFAMLGLSLLCFLYEKNPVGLILLTMFFGFCVLTIKSWKTYQANLNRRTARDDKEQLQDQDFTLVKHTNED
jgi:hypothetical protein